MSYGRCGITPSLQGFQIITVTRSVADFLPMMSRTLWDCVAPPTGVKNNGTADFNFHSGEYS